MTFNKHDARDCRCVPYEPDIRAFEIRLDGTNYQCRSCYRFVDPNKWKGGWMNFGNKSKYVRPTHCPCCGIKMSKRRRAKKRLEESILDQIANPNRYQKFAMSKLPRKIELLESNVLIPRVN